MSDERNQTMPVPIRNATLSFSFSMVLGLLILAIDPNPVTQNVSGFFVFAVAAITMLIMAFLIYKIAKGRNWARILFLVLFVIGLIPYMPQLASMFDRSALVAAVSLTQMCMQLFGLYLIFSKPGSLWFIAAPKPDVL